MNHPHLIWHAAASLLLATPPLAALADSWTFTATPSATAGRYEQSALRHRYAERGLMLSGEYLDQGGLTLGYSQSTVAMNDASPSIEQRNRVLSAHKFLWFDALPGKVGLRLDRHRLDNNDTSATTNHVDVLAGQLSWLSSDGLLYVDLGHARSRYPNQLSLRQYTPTLGVGLNGGSDWIQWRSYLIFSNNAARSAQLTHTRAPDWKWTHFLAGTNPWLPDTFTLGWRAGKTFYAVDMDALSVANLADLATHSTSLGLSWRIDTHAKAYLQLSKNRFRQVDLNNDYRIDSGYAGLSLNW